VSNMECWASSVLGMHIPFLRRACDITAALEAFYQAIVTSSPVGCLAAGTGKSGWGGVRRIRRFGRISPCPTVQAALSRPYMSVGI
jgi:hypothetical protein